MKFKNYHEMICNYSYCFRFNKEYIRSRKKQILNRLKQIDDDIIRDYDYFYGNYDENIEDNYDDGEPYARYISRELYSGETHDNENFETYKNMFESENLLKSKEQIDDTIDDLNNFFENSKFGDNLDLSDKNNNAPFDLDETQKYPKFPHFPIVPDKSDFEQIDVFKRQNNNNRKNFNRNIRGSYKNEDISAGRSFGSSRKTIPDASNGIDNKIPSKTKLDRMVINLDTEVIRAIESNLVPINMNNNNLKVRKTTYQVCWKIKRFENVNLRNELLTNYNF